MTTHVRESDEELMRWVKGGGRDALSVLLRRHANPLLTFIRRMAGDAHRSEELFQDVFLAVWTNRARYRPPGPFRSWLFGIAANKCRTDVRRRRMPHVSLDEAAAEAVCGTAPVDAALAVETAVFVQQAVMRLPPRQREVVVLRIWNGLSYAEIAAALDRTESTVRAAMHHALAAMRRHLEPRMRQ